jgi:hypothetical protein
MFTTFLGSCDVFNRIVALRNIGGFGVWQNAALATANTRIGRFTKSASRDVRRLRPQDRLGQNQVSIIP